MYEEPSGRTPLPRAAGVLAGVMVICAMAYLSSVTSSPEQSGDWAGYGRLYNDYGGWLIDQGRDPGFIWLLRQARHVFGPDGYSDFRLALLVVFGVAAVWLAHEMPVQWEVRELSSILTALVLITAFSLKGLVQIREGLAFLFIVLPVATIYARNGPGLARSGIGLAIAASIHSEMVFFAGGWLAAACLVAFPDEILASKSVQRAMLVGSLAFGAIIAFTVLQNADAIRFLLQDFGVDESAHVQGGFWKYTYWVFSGLIALEVRREIIKSTANSTRFGYAYATSIASVVIPLVYTICAILVFANFSTPALTAMLIRLLYTSLELGMIIVVLRGNGTVVTAAIAAFMFADRMRLILYPA